jgi:hypothetical protein
LQQAVTAAVSSANEARWRLIFGDNPKNGSGRLHVCQAMCTLCVDHLFHEAARAPGLHAVLWLD